MSRGEQRGMRHWKNLWPFPQLGIPRSPSTTVPSSHRAWQEAGKGDGVWVPQGCGDESTHVGKPSVPSCPRLPGSLSSPAGVGMKNPFGFVFFTLTVEA